MQAVYLEDCVAIVKVGQLPIGQMFTGQVGEWTNAHQTKFNKTFFFTFV